MRHQFLIVGIFLFSLSLQAQNVLNLNDEDLLGYIQTKNQKVLIKDQELKASESRTGVLVRSYLPEVELYHAEESFKLGRTNSKNQPAQGVEARVNLFNGGRDGLRNKKANLAVERLKSEKQLTVVEQLKIARELYWEGFYLKEVLLILKQAQEVNQRNLSAAQRRLQSGVATQSDRLEFEMKDVDLKQSLAKTELEFKNTSRALAILLGFDDKTTIQFSGTYQHDHDWQKEVNHSHHEHSFTVKPLELKSQEVELESRANRRGFLPRVDAYAAWNQFNQREEDFTDSRDRRESVVGLRMTLALSDVYHERSESQAQKAEAQALKLEADELKRTLDSHIHADLDQLNLLHNLVHDTEENIKRAQRYYDLTQREYARGVKNSPDVLGASEKIFETRLKHLELIRDFQIAKAHLKAKTTP